MSLNYFKAIGGSIAFGNLRQAAEVFDDADPYAALALAREMLRPPALVSVWRPAATVPGDVPVVGQPMAGGGA